MAKKGTKRAVKKESSSEEEVDIVSSEPELNNGARQVMFASSSEDEGMLDDDFLPQGSSDLEEDEDIDIGGEEDEEEDDKGDAPAAEVQKMILGLEDSDSPLDIRAVLERIQRTVQLLQSKTALPASRSELMARLTKDITVYYGYSEFMAEKVLQLFSLDEAIAFFEANETPRPVTIRTNTLRTRRRDLAAALIARGVNVDVLEEQWGPAGLQIFESPVPLGATPEYLAGHYMLQSAASFLPVMALAPQPQERILDMAAAPGGKSSHIAALQQNTGQLFANDPSVPRARALAANLHRLGVQNAVVCSLDGRTFPGTIAGFDRVLLDAPCSGTGVIAKDPSVKTSKTAEDFSKLGHLQRELLLAAIDCCVPGGTVVYSTCSVMIEENEEIINYALGKRSHVRLVDSGLSFGVPGMAAFRGKQFHPSMKLARRFYPHVHNMDGFFVAKLQINNVSSKNNIKTKKQEEEEEEEEVEIEKTPKNLQKKQKRTKK